MVLALATVLPLSAAGKSKQRTAVPVPDAAAAIEIGRAAALKVYGKTQIHDEEPLTASLEDGVWTVYGSLCCDGANGKRTCEPGRCVGGVVNVKIRQGDGKVLSIVHWK